MTRWLAVGLLVFLASCETKITVTFTAEVAGLAALAEQRRPALEAETGLQFDLAEGASDSPGGLLVSAGDVGPPSVGTPLAFGVEAATRYVTAAVWTRAHRTSEGLWNELPLFFDVVGLTMFTTEARRSEPLLLWSSLGQGGQVTGAGGSGVLRDLIALALPPATLGDWLAKGRWNADTWRLSKADVQLGYLPGAQVQFLETFRDFYRANPPGFRVFTPLAQKDETLGLSGRLVTLKTLGTDPRLAKAATAWAKVLTSRPLQEAYSRASGWMPASLGTPVLDSASASIRRLVLQAGWFEATSSLSPGDRAEADRVFGSERLVE